LTLKLMHSSKTKINFINLRPLLVMAAISIYVLTFSVSAFAANPPAPEKACNKKYDGNYANSKNIDACVDGYKGGRNLKSPASVCNGYSGDMKDACMEGYGKGACSIKNPGQNALNQCLNQNPIVKDLRIVVNFLSAGVGIVIVGSVIVGAIQYILAGNNPNAISAAKKRLQDTLIALLAFFFIYTFLSWLVPGGLLFNL
jgi:hypothetical protein